MDRFCIVISTVAEADLPAGAIASGAFDDVIRAHATSSARLFMASPGGPSGEVKWKEVNAGEAVKVADFVLDYRATATPEPSSLADLVHSLCDRLPPFGYYVDLYWICQEVADRSGLLPLALVAALMRLTEWHRGKVIVLPAQVQQLSAFVSPLPVELASQFGFTAGNCSDRGYAAMQDTYWRGNLVMDSAVLSGCSLRRLKDGCKQRSLCPSGAGDRSAAPRTSVPSGNLLLITDVHLDCLPADLPCHQRYAFEFPQSADAVLLQSRLLVDQLAEGKRGLLLKLDWLLPGNGRRSEGGVVSATDFAAAPDDVHRSCRCGKLGTQDWLSHAIQGRWQQHHPAHAAETCCSKLVGSAFFLLTADYVDDAKTLVATCIRHPDAVRCGIPGLRDCQCCLPSGTAPTDTGCLQLYREPLVGCSSNVQHACEGAAEEQAAAGGDSHTVVAVGQQTLTFGFLDLFLPHNPVQPRDACEHHLVRRGTPAAPACQGRPNDQLMPSAADVQEVECDTSCWPEWRALTYRRHGSSCRKEVRESRSPSSSADDVRHRNKGLCLTIHEMARRLSAALAALTGSDQLPAADAGSRLPSPPDDAVLPWPACKVAYAHGVHYNLDNSAEKEEAQLLRYCSSLVRQEISSTCSSDASQGFPILVSQAASGVVALRPSQTASARRPKQSSALKGRAGRGEPRAERLRPQRTLASTNGGPSSAMSTRPRHQRHDGSSRTAAFAVGHVTAPQSTVLATCDSAPCSVAQTSGTNPGTCLPAPSLSLTARPCGISIADEAGHVPDATHETVTPGPSRLESVREASSRSKGDSSEPTSAVPLSMSTTDEPAAVASVPAHVVKQARADAAQQAAAQAQSKESRSERHKRRLLDIVTKVLRQKGLTPESSTAFGACQQRLFSTVKGFVKDLPNSHSLGENMRRLAVRFCDEVIEFETRTLKAKHSSSKARTPQVP